MSYYEFASDSGTGYGSLQTFQHPLIEFTQDGETLQGQESLGWYWWPCFPGCLPDGDAVGPFQTGREAVIDAGGIWDDLSESNGAVG